MDQLITLKQLYKQHTGLDPVEPVLMDKSGSNRQYYRLNDASGQHSLVGVIGTIKEENEAFIYMARHFKSKGLPVPEVYLQSVDGMSYIQEDLGPSTLYALIRRSCTTSSFTAGERRQLKRSLRELARFQFEGNEGFDYSRCYPAAAFDRRSIMWDLNYFKYCFLKTINDLDFNEALLENDFERLADELLKVPAETFMYRDFQSRNVMVRPDKSLAFIDFQGGRKGPYYYDVVSFVWQSRARFPESLRKELVDEYLTALRHYIPDINQDQFRKTLQLFVLFRTLQVLGAYGFRGYFEKKPDFIDNSIIPAIANLRHLLAERSFNEFPYLSQVLRKMVEKPDFNGPRQKILTITVLSFAYKRGIPADNSGNGGGYVFDCRAVNNPGKYDRYKSFTGVDQPVIDFLEKDGEITTFLEHAYALVDNNVQRYIERGFTNLMVAFGCTGGQHRSVYSAEHLARHIHDKFPTVKVVLHHRELGLENTFNPIQS